MKTLPILLTVVVICVFAISDRCEAMVFAFIDGIAGVSSDDPLREQWADVVSFSQPVEGDGTLTGTGAVIQPFRLRKIVDVSSPLIAQAAADGRNIPLVVVEGLLSIEAERTTLFKWEMENAIITSYQIGGASPSGVPLEEVSFYYNKIEYQYAVTHDGINFDTVKMRWDNASAPPMVEVTADTSDFVLVTEFFVPEPGMVALLLPGVVVMCGRRIRTGRKRGVAVFSR